MHLTVTQNPDLGFTQSPLPATGKRELEGMSTAVATPASPATLTAWDRPSPSVEAWS